jgi:lysophospholipase L1-like esterase
MLFSALASPALGDDGKRDGKRNVAPPKAFYLSLGDSNGFGLQFDRLFAMLDAGTYTPGAFNTGYTDVLAARMHRLRPDQQTVNLSCPGETTDTMINGGCFFTSPEPEGPGLTLHTTYAGSQLDTAVSFLRSHRHQANPVTVSIGGIDAANVIADTCNFDTACIGRSGLRDSLGRGLDRILGALHAAAPDTQIILVVFYNPFSITNPGTDGLWRRYYTTVEKDAARRNGVRVADASKIFQGKQVCRLTFLCASGDSHPNDAGYRQIADQIFDVLGYRHLARDRDDRDHADKKGSGKHEHEKENHSDRDDSDRED